MLTICLEQAACSDLSATTAAALAVDARDLGFSLSSRSSPR
jgi:hypothetical protein